MGFPRNVRDQILIDSARHCCVCHRYKGVKVEVHHIQPEAIGGENTYENAIALCFDCHADAGHYNPSHPRGTKFSPAELQKAKDNWLEMVARNNVQQPKELDQFYCRYYLCKNYEQLVEIAKGDLTRFPVENPLLIKNEVISSLREIIRVHPHSFRHANEKGKSFPSKEKYIELKPGAVIPDSTDGQFSYFEVIRTPSREELEELDTKDGLLRIMLETDLHVEQIAMAGGYRDDCGGVPFLEEYIFRKLWCSFLAITNISNRPVALYSVIGQHLTGLGFQTLTQSSSESKSLPLPKAPMPPNATALLPLAVILPPFHPIDSEIFSETYDNNEHVQVVCHEGNTSINSGEYLVYKNQMIINSICYELDGDVVTKDIHNFDLSNMYTIDRFWECGSCPHLFFVGERVSYAREILAHCNSKIGIDQFIVPKDITSMVIAEIEDEITEIISLSINGEAYLKNISLKKTQFIEIQVSPGSKITVIGQYLPDATVKGGGLCGVRRNELVSKFLIAKKQSLKNAFT